VEKFHTAIERKAASLNKQTAAAASCLLIPSSLFISNCVSIAAELKRGSFMDVYLENILLIFSRFCEGDFLGFED
jgi:hypothetical protein